MKKPLSLLSIISYGLGDMANNFVFAFGILFLLNYYTDVVGIPLVAAGAMLAMVRIFDAVTDIIAGHLIDRTTTRWGRFRPFLLWGALPLMLLNLAVFSVPNNFSQDGKLIYAYVTYALLGIAYSFINISYGSLATAMTQEPRERANLGASRMFMAVCTFSFLTMVVGPIMAKLKGETLQAALTQATLIMGIIGTLLYFICFKNTHETIERKADHPKFKESIKTIFKNKPLLILCASTACMLLGYSSSGASLIYFARYIIGDAKTFFITLGIINLLTAFIFAPILPKIAETIGKKNTFLCGLTLSFSGYLMLFLSPSNSITLIYGAFLLTSAGVKATMAIAWALEADTVEYGEWRTGIRIEGMTYSFFSLMRKLGYSIGGSMPAFILAFYGYIPNSEKQSNIAILGIQQAVALVPAILFMTAFILMLFYPLTDRKFSEIVDEIKKDRQHQPNPRQ